MKYYFITGTDTDCGKTYVTCQLLDYLKRKTKSAQALKPVVTGLTIEDGRAFYSDLEQLKQHNAISEMEINGWKFAEPVSPHLAAADLSAEKIADFCRKKDYQQFEYVLIEGAGGLLVPLNDRQSWIDFIHLMNIPVILVVGMKLGCLNHALLTDSVLFSSRCKSAGWIANVLNPDMLEIEKNIATLKKRLRMPYLGRTDYQKGLIIDENTGTI
ncbi:dethiobiotin synthetase [Legionella birminghamensis]|uniref:ATP-dependent dethiobiotin synthetase BioD n=1 Tax=Legionella birminghamensis TaxID=28083 RepID=A0A378I9R3_9GAMM|nr:dethiobiotin synthase [Legionella birminghamensis]KTC69304.1 dethiobiotin synthetase [Legionella birminghamensis]STX31566.1 dethiobiotin synthetase [Legionella birminghamensis]